MDRILISDLSARCIIGINQEERREKQDVVINLIIFADLGKAAKSDRFEDSVDYRALKKKVLSIVEGSKYYLLEALAESIAEICLEQPGVVQVQVRVDKPSALRFARSVGVEIERKREG
ncbi:MAG: dihydroneopterin aldolase [candidate division Zixibacteria bacterium]|nr:dihydroneopterin aldolase [candidate division Zixibacteria bacterium]